MTPTQILHRREARKYAARAVKLADPKRSGPMARFAASFAFLAHPELRDESYVKADPMAAHEDSYLPVPETVIDYDFYSDYGLSGGEHFA